MGRREPGTKVKSKKIANTHKKGGKKNQKVGLFNVA
jgi:hypothetical protein